MAEAYLRLCLQKSRLPGVASLFRKLLAQGSTPDHIRKCTENNKLVNQCIGNITTDKRAGPARV